MQTLQSRSQKLESLGTLAGGVAHDFNNIAINGNAKLALEDFPSDHPASQNLSEIAKAGARAADLVRRILAFSRPQDQERKPQPVQPVVEEALELVRATLPASVHIECSFSPDFPLVALDSTQLHQVIVNLATNASHPIGDKPGTIILRLDSRTFSAADLLAVPDVHEGRYVCSHRQRRWLRYGSRHTRPRLRSLLYNQVSRAGHWPGSFRRPRNRHQPRWRHHRL